MNFCSNCGTQLQNNEKFCHNCGAPLQQTAAAAPVTPIAPAAEAPLEPDWEQGAERLRYADTQPRQVQQQYRQPSYQPQYQQPAAYQPQYQQMQPKDDTLHIVIRIFLILGCIAYGCFIIPLAWCLPITISICKKMKNGEPVGLGLKISALLFVNLIAGVCLLASNDL